MLIRPGRRRRRRSRALLTAGLLAAVGALVLFTVGPMAGGGEAMGDSARAGLDEDGRGEGSTGAGRPGATASIRTAARGAAAAAEASGEAAADRWPHVEWRDSTAIGSPTAGRLVDGVKVPREGRHHFTWDPVERTSPNRPWRRWGTDYVVRATLRVLADHRREFPRAPRLGVGDLSRPNGGDFGVAYGPIGHVSHQNGLDVDVYYPLSDGAERAPLSVEEIDLRLSQDLVDRFVAAGAEKVFVGPSTGLTGPPDVVQAIPNHDNHIHARFPAES